MPRIPAIPACVATLVLLFPPARVSSADPVKEEQVYRVGINGAYLPNLKQETLRRWVRETGATMPRVGMRLDLFQKGMPDHPDAWVRDASAAGGAALAMLFNQSQPVTRPDGTRDEGCRPPERLWEPIFDNGSDDPASGSKINPRNEWAVFVAAMAERYDGDGVADAPGSPKVVYFSAWNEPDWLPWPQRPKGADDKAMRNWFGRDFHDLARLAFVSHRAARFANPDAKVGMQLCFNQSLGLLLDDAKHPLARAATSSTSTPTAARPATTTASATTASSRSSGRCAASTRSETCHRRDSSAPSPASAVMRPAARRAGPRRRR